MNPARSATDGADEPVEKSKDSGIAECWLLRTPYSSVSPKNFILSILWPAERSRASHPFGCLGILLLVSPLHPHRFPIEGYPLAFVLSSAAASASRDGNFDLKQHVDGLRNDA